MFSTVSVCKAERTFQFSSNICLLVLYVVRSEGPRVYRPQANTMAWNEFFL